MKSLLSSYLVIGSYKSSECFVEYGGLLRYGECQENIPPPPHTFSWIWQGMERYFSLGENGYQSQEPQQSKDDKCVWLRPSPQFLVNQQRDQMLFKGQ